SGQRRRQHMHRIGLITLGVALLLGQPAAAADGKAPPACSGTNMLDELQGTEVHARILAGAGAQENADALLWKIEQGDKPASYLFGTVHLTDERLSAHSPVLKAAFAGSRRLVLELDDMSSGNFMKAFVRL